MRYKNLDLNLLVAFDTLMETRSVTQAAQRLRLSQPAVSAALDRLRDYFGDPLFVPNGKRMMPTPTADGMSSIVKGLLSEVDSLVSASRGFDAASSQRVFHLVASDYISTVLLTPLCALLEKEAPRVRLDIALPAGVTPEHFMQGEVDLWLAPEEFMLPGQPSELIWLEKHVVVGWSKNPLMKAPLTERAYMRSGHVGVLIGRRGPPFAERQLSALGKHCRYEIVVPAFSLVPGAVQGTQRLATMHERLARVYASKYALAIAPMPFGFAPMREMMQYHRMRAGDAGLAWLRSKVLEVANLVSGAV